MKQVLYIILFLISANGVAQEFADKEYYLIDSLVLEELSKGDRQLLDSCLKKYHLSNEDTSKITILSNLIEQMISEDWKSYQFYQSDQLQLLLKNKPSEKVIKALQINLATALNNIGYIHKDQGQIKLALDYYNRSIKIQEKIGNKQGIAGSYNSLGMIYYNQGQIKEALEYFSLNLKVYEEIDYNEGIATSLNNIGAIYDDQGQVKEALDFYSRCLKIQEEIGNKLGIAKTLNNIGVIFKNQGKVKDALDYFRRCIELYEEIGNKLGVADVLSNIGIIFYHQGKVKEAMDYFNRNLKMYEEVDYKEGIAFSLNNIAGIYDEQGKRKDALEYGLRSLKIAQEIGYSVLIERSSELLSKVYEKQDNGMKALEMYKLHIQMKDSMNNEATQKASAKQLAKYEYEKQKVVDDAEHEKLLAIEQEEKEKQQILTGATAGGLGLVVIFLVFVFNRLRITKRQKLVIEKQKVEVEQQKEVVEKSHSELEEKNQEIMDSITYAKRIQSAILPPLKLVKKYLKESFILYKPKDVVAGDFYWMESIIPTGNNKETKVFFAAADCTGHGVPGAMVSVVCNNALNRSVREYGLTDPGEILTKTREIVIQEFEKSEEDVKDGMDIALCSIEGMKLQYAGAHNPLWIIRNGAIIETKANKQPIGKFDNPEPYTTHSFDLEQRDSIYVFSDGYIDQFGGEKGKKFKSKAFRELLLSIQDKSMEEQNTIINGAFETWRGDLEQIDDVCVIGVRV